MFFNAGRVPLRLGNVGCANRTALPLSRSCMNGIAFLFISKGGEDARILSRFRNIASIFGGMTSNVLTGGPAFSGNDVGLNASMSMTIVKGSCFSFGDIRLIITDSSARLGACSVQRLLTRGNASDTSSTSASSVASTLDQGSSTGGSNSGGSARGSASSTSGRSSNGLRDLRNAIGVRSLVPIATTDGVGVCIGTMSTRNCAFACSLFSNAMGRSVASFRAATSVSNNSCAMASPTNDGCRPWGYSVDMVVWGRFFLYSRNDSRCLWAMCGCWVDSFHVDRADFGFWRRGDTKRGFAPIGWIQRYRGTE